MLEAVALASYMGVMSITPGPNNIMLTASGVNFGFRRSLPHMLGITLGCTVQLLLCAALYGSIATHLGELRPWLAAIGCSYLLWLSLKLARASAPGRNDAARPMSFLAAALFQWVNPKAWVMVLNACVLFLPRDSHASTLAAMALLSMSVNLPCIAIWAWGGEQLRHWLQQAWALRLFNTAMALLLAGTALWMLVSELGIA